MFFNKPKPDQMGRLPIHYAANDRDMDDELRKLIAQGQDVNAREDSNWTPLHFAANKSKLETIKILLAAGADVDAANNDGETPLLLAVGRNRPQTPAVIKLLREYGADPYHVANDGFSPIELARMCDGEEIHDAFADLPPRTLP
jgi:uncharacterized protein